MQINTSSTAIASVAAHLSGGTATKSSSAGKSTPASAPASAAASGSPAVHSTATAPPSGAARAAPAPQSVAAAVSTATSTLQSSTYSTSAGGKSYSANISQANGTYTLSVPNLPGASVSGSSLTAAESALSIRVDTLV